MRPVLPSETRVLLPGDLARAQDIAATVTALVADRDSYVARQNIDPAFAYPQANWGDGANNAFRALFDRIRRCDEEAVGQLRAFCQPFTGFRLYEMTIAGMPPHDLSGYTDARIAQNLERNLPYVDHWLSLPRHRVFVPPRRFGEIGHDIDGVIVKVTAGVLVSGTNAIVVNAGANDQITLRGLDIDGLGTGLVGVKFFAGKALIVENCQIYGFTQNGIEATLGATASVDVKDTRINNVVGAGIKVHTTAGNVALLADHVAISRVGTNGVEAAGGALGTVSNSTIFAASNAVAATANGATLNVDNTELLSSLVGANATVAGAILELNNNSIYFNNTAIGGAVGSQVLTAANNKLSGNASPGANPSGNVTIK